MLHLCQFIEVIPMHYLVTNNLLREAWEQRAIILIYREPPDNMTSKLLDRLLVCR